MNRIVWLGTFVMAVSFMAAAQDQPAPAPAPDTATPTAAPEAVAPADAPKEVREIEIVEPAGPNERRRIRVVGQDGGFWADNGEEFHELSVIMDKSLEFNPEIQAIRAEISALMARLRQLEMKTATDVARKGVEIKRLKDKREKDKKLVEEKLLAPEELAELDAEIAARDVEFKYLLGQNSLRTIDMDDRTRTLTVRRGDAPFAPVALAGGEARPDLADTKDKRLLEVLESPVRIGFEDAPLEDVIDFIVEIYEMNFNIDVPARAIPITINLKNVPLRSALAAVTDANPDLVFVFRDYGVFATTRDRAVSIAGPTIPENVPYYEGGFFFRRKGGPESEQAEKILDYVEVKPSAKAPKGDKGLKGDAPAPEAP